jgi:hypothetical protein
MAAILLIYLFYIMVWINKKFKESGYYIELPFLRKLRQKLLFAGKDMEDIDANELDERLLAEREYGLAGDGYPTYGYDEASEDIYGQADDIYGQAEDIYGQAEDIYGQADDQEEYLYGQEDVYEEDVYEEDAYEEDVYEEADDTYRVDEGAYKDDEDEYLYKPEDEDGHEPEEAILEYDPEVDILAYEAEYNPDYEPLTQGFTADINDDFDFEAVARELKAAEEALKSIEQRSEMINNTIKLVDSDKNIDTISVSDYELPKLEEMGISDLISSGFDRMGSGELEQAAEFFNEALMRRLSKELELNLVAKLCYIYKEIGLAEYALYIVDSYRTKYSGRINQDILTEMEMIIQELE